MFDVVIINDDLERAYEELKEILDEVRERRRVNARTGEPAGNSPTRQPASKETFFPSSSSGNQKSSGSQIIGGRAGWLEAAEKKPRLCPAQARRASVGPLVVHAHL